MNVNRPTFNCFTYCNTVQEQNNELLTSAFNSVDLDEVEILDIDGKARFDFHFKMSVHVILQVSWLQ